MENKVNNDLAQELKSLIALVEQLPGGIDEDADPENQSPEDATAHIGGLIWKRLKAMSANLGIESEWELIAKDGQVDPVHTEKCWERMCKSFHNTIADALGVPHEPQAGFHPMVDAIKRLIEACDINHAKFIDAESAAIKAERERDELQTKLNEYTVNRQVGTCCDCGAAIWFRQARIQDESGMYHPFCRVTRQRDELIEILISADGMLDDSAYYDQWRKKYDIVAHLENPQNLPLTRRAENAEAKVRELSHQLEFDRSAVADGVSAVKKAVQERGWLTEGRGPFEWNDDSWHKEFAEASKEILAAIEPLAKIAANWKSCPMKAEEVAEARIDLKRERDELLIKLAQLRDAAKKAENALQAGLPNQWREINELCALCRETGFNCAARAFGTAGGNDPQDCGWPGCGCDPHADRVIEALQESGALISRCENVDELRERLVATAKASHLDKMQCLSAVQSLADRMHYLIHRSKTREQIFAPCEHGICLICEPCAECSKEQVGYVQEVHPHESPSCHVCGNQMVPDGFKCVSCGASTKPTETEMRPRCPKCKSAGLAFECSSVKFPKMLCVDCKHIEPVRDVADFAQFFGAVESKAKQALVTLIEWLEDDTLEILKDTVRMGITWDEKDRDLLRQKIAEAKEAIC